MSFGIEGYIFVSMAIVGRIVKITVNVTEGALAAIALKSEREWSGVILIVKAILREGINLAVTRGHIVSVYHKGACCGGT